MGRGLFGAIAVAVGVLIGILLGDPYFGWVTARVIGEQTVWFQNADGSRTTKVSGPAVTLPDWIPVMPGALRITASRVVDDKGRPSKAGSLELLSHEDVAPIVAFYAKEFAARGFTVAPQRPQGEADFGRLMNAVEGEVRAANPSLGVEARVVVRSRQGILLAPRLVEVQWFDRQGAGS
ncbi:MAG: hypothetical protein HS109_14935 [Burkholderiales bacterium]|nr:hypothetical protein [Burkholderiales bacterium]